ncbi:MAG: sigma-54 dependent transcriptional regulator [Deltaproteobacteria bacterium]|nr:sigma-54 dependent transcriptional regulator [Deltaproteobacteria bacterium]
MEDPIRLLVVDDEAHVCISLEGWFLEEGYAVSTARSGLEGLEVAAREQPQIILVDFKMPQMDGLTFLTRVLEVLPNATVVLMTAFGSVDSAVQALKEGAYDYILKPFDPEQLSRLVAKAAARYATPTAARAVEERLEAALPPVIAAEGGEMAQVLEQLERVAGSRASILLRGESGTGRRLLARRIHAHSPRRFGPFVTVDCSSVSATDVGCDLFGDGEGRQGGMELAREGTLYLASLDRMMPRIQIELLRRLEAAREAPSELRLISATEGDLELEVASGRFRRDLFLRAAVFTVDLPPLRERPEDLPLLARHFLAGLGEGRARPVERISEAALELLLHHSWPGNVRELQQVIEAAVLRCEGAELKAEHLQLADPLATRDLRLATAEARHLRRVMLLCGHDVDRAARELGLELPALLEKLHHHGIAQR